MNLGALLGGGLPSISMQAPGAMDAVGDAAKKKKKEGIASMLSGIGKGNETQTGGLQMPQQQSFDLQSYLASLFGG